MNGSIIRGIRVGGADAAFAPPLFGPSYSFKWNKAALKPRFIGFGSSYPTLPRHFLQWTFLVRIIHEFGYIFRNISGPRNGGAEWTRSG